MAEEKSVGSEDWAAEGTQREVDAVFGHYGVDKCVNTVY